MRITQEEIARRLGVSQALVSRALSGKAAGIGAAAATVARIRELAQAVQYRPSAAALTLRGAPTRTIGVVIKDFADPFFGHMIGELQALAQREQFALLLTGGGPDGRPADVAVFDRHQPDGLLLGGSDFEPAGLARFIASGRPVVRLGLGQPRRGIVAVEMDQKRGLADLLAYLAGLGHVRVGFVGTASAPNARRAALVKALAGAQGLTIRPDWIVAVKGSAAQAGAVGMRRLLAGRVRPTAVIAAEDAIALAALRAVHEQGLQVPRDVSLAGIDDIPAAALAIPALTTLRQPVRAMVQMAFEALTSPAPAGRAALRLAVPELVRRESVGRFEDNADK